MIEQTQFLSTVFLSSEFKLDDIYYGVNSLGENVRAHFFFAETNFWGSLKKSQNRKH